MKKLYILIRSDLSTKAYMACQGGHALAQWILENPGQAQEWGNHTLIYLRVDNEEQLKFWIDVIEMGGEKCVCFREPDLGNEITAIATYGDGKLFNGIRLL